MELLKNCKSRREAKEWLKINGYRNETEIDEILNNWEISKTEIKKVIENTSTITFDMYNKG